MHTKNADLALHCFSSSTKCPKIVWLVRVGLTAI